MADRLEEIRERLAKATPGPWRWQWSGYEVADGITDKLVEFDRVLPRRGNEPRRESGKR